MAVFVYSGRLARAAWMVQDLDNDGKSEWVFVGDAGLPNTGWQSFPYLREVRIRTTSGVEPITAIGVETIAALEEVLVEFQEIEFNMLVQPTTLCKSLWSKALRSGAPNLPFLGVRVLLMATADVATGLEIHNCLVSRCDFEQPNNGPATLRMTLSGGYVRLVNNPGSNFIPAMNYDTTAGIILIREGTIQHQGLPDTLTPMRIGSLSVRINNRLEALYTFQNFSGLTSDNLQAIRVWNAVYEGRTEITGSISAYVYPTAKSLVAAKVPQFTLTAKWYSLAGQDTPGPIGDNTTPQLQIQLVGARFRNIDVPMSPDRPIALDAEFEAVGIAIS